MNRSWPFPRGLGGDTPGLVVELHNDDDDDDPEMQEAGECQAAHEGRNASVAEVDDDEGDNDDDEANNDDNDSDDEGDDDGGGGCGNEGDDLEDDDDEGSNGENTDMYGLDFVCLGSSCALADLIFALAITPNRLCTRTHTCPSSFTFPAFFCPALLSYTLN